MKIIVFLAVIFCISLVTSCDRFKEIVAPLIDSTPGNRLFTKRMFTAATADTLMLIENLYDDHGERCFVKPGDKLEIRYYDSALPYEYHEAIITAATTLDTLLGQIAGAAGVSMRLDTAGTGTIIITDPGTPKMNLYVDNLTHPESHINLQKVLTWGGEVKVGSRSEGSLLKIADMDSPLRTLRDSSGNSLGLEPDDPITIYGSTPDGPISRFYSLTVGEGTSMKALSDLLDYAIEKSAPSFGNTYASSEKGKLSIEMKSGTARDYSVKLMAENNDADIVSPARFNSVFIFNPLTDSM